VRTIYQRAKNVRLTRASLSYLSLIKYWKRITSGKRLILHLRMSKASTGMMQWRR